MATKLNMTLLLRRDDFTAENKKTYKLLEGEPGYCTVTKVFKIGDGNTTWENLPIANKAQIEEILQNYYTKTEIDEIVGHDYVDDQNPATGLYKVIDDKVYVSHNLNSTDINDINTRIGAGFSKDNTIADAIAGTKNEVIGISGDPAGANTIYGAKAFTTEAVDQAKSDLIGGDADETYAKTIKGAKDYAKAYADSLAGNYDAEGSAAQVKSEVIGASTDTKTADTIYGAKAFATDAVAAEAEIRKNADEALDGRLDIIEGRLENVANVMDFVGARTVSVVEGVITVTANEGETFNKGDVVVDNGGKEYVFDGAAWHEFGYADDNTAAIEGLQSRMTEAEKDIDDLEKEFNTEAGRVTVAEAAIAQETEDRQEADEALGDRITALEGALEAAPAHTHANKPELDKIATGDVAKWNNTTTAVADVLAGNTAVPKAVADAKGNDIENTYLAKASLDSGDIESLKISNDGAYTSIEGGAIYAQGGSLCLEGLASNNPEAFKITGWEHLEGREEAVYTTTIGASVASFGGSVTAADKVTAPEFVGDLTGTAAKATADAAGNVITETYATKEEVEAINVGVTTITAGTDIVVTPTEGTGAVTVAHTDYGSGTLTKDPAALENGDAYVFTGLDLSNGHVTGGAMKSLADILSAMEFILDGGTAE